MSSQSQGRLGRPLRSLLPALLTTAVVAAMLTAAPAQAGSSRPVVLHGATASTAKVATGHHVSKRARAEGALARVQRILSGHGDGRAATLALRNLWRYQSDLSARDRGTAQRILSRPTDPGDDDQYSTNDVKVSCSLVCVHWVETTSDAVPLTDANVNGIPDFVDSTIAEMNYVYTTYVNAGYRAPDPDGTLGGDNKTDIYLANIGPDGLYGYCTSDQQVPNAGPFNAWAYCVLDNDYQPSEFPTNTPIENLQVTAAHEYFHATQFAYDAFDDGWFMEATATWAEDELYTDVNDNLNYTSSGPLAHPEIPLDAFTGLHQYGDWIFFRYLTEKYSTLQGGLPSLILKMWQKADGAAGGPDQYSSQAINSVLATQGSTMAKEFAKFSDANRRPRSVYSEGAANGYPTAPLGHFTKKNGWYQTKLDHLTSATGVYKPGNGTSKLKITVDLAKKVTAPMAVVSVYARSGSVSSSFISLDSTGAGSKVVPFSKSKVNRVEVTLVNGSIRFAQCFAQQSPFSCSGIPVDENLLSKVKAAAK
jgi:hypothetical protein